MFLRLKHKSKQDLSLLTDEELIDHYKSSGNTELIGVLYTRYTYLVFGVCMKYLKNEDDASDAVMSVFEKLIKDLKTHKVQKFKSWLYSVAKNHCLMELRKTSVSRKNFDEMVQVISSEFMETDDVLHPDIESEDILIDKMMSALGKLKNEHKTCLELLYLQKKSYKEVAEITGYNMKEVKSYIQNGKRNLKNMMSE